VSAILKQELLQLRRSDETRTDAKGSQFGDRLFEFGPQARFLADSSEGNRVFTSFDYLAFYTCICQSGHQVTTY